MTMTRRWSFESRAARCQSRRRAWARAMFRPALARCSRATTAIRTRRRDHRRAEGPQPVGRQRGLRPQRERAGDGDANAFDRELVRLRTIKRRPSAGLDGLPALGHTASTSNSITSRHRRRRDQSRPRTVRPSDRPGRAAPLVWKTSSCVASAAFHARRSSAVMTRHRDRRPTSTAASRRPTASPTARAWAVCEADVGRSSAKAAKSRRDHGRPVRDDVLGRPATSWAEGSDRRNHSSIPRRRPWSSDLRAVGERPPTVTRGARRAALSPVPTSSRPGGRRVSSASGHRRVPSKGRAAARACSTPAKRALAQSSLCVEAAGSGSSSVQASRFSARAPRRCAGRRGGPARRSSPRDRRSAVARRPASG
jgi:hypothetical protein